MTQVSTKTGRDMVHFILMKSMGRMKFSLVTTAVFLASQLGCAQACELKWPNAQITIPDEVHRFILIECIKYKGWTEESVDACIEGESYGYRAVVTMLMDPETAETSAERYRACRAGLGDQGGRFHRRRAECIGIGFGYIWQFEFSRRASLLPPGAPTATQYASSAMPETSIAR